LLLEEDLAFDALPADERERRPLSTLGQAFARGRLSHALLLAGPTGSGRRHAAVRLAQLLSCEAPHAGGPCRECDSCARVDRGLDPDVHVLVPPVDPKTGLLKGEIPVERVRALQEKLSFRSTGTRRFVLIDPADKLSLVSQEAVLKTLEEPPDGVTIALVSARPNALKPTVRSRCQLVRFATPRAESVAAVLESRGRSAEEAALAAALAGGDLRRALSIEAEEAAELWLEIGRRLYELLGARGESRARDLALDLVPQGSGGAADAELESRLGLVERVLRDVMLAGGRAQDSDELLATRLTHPGGVKAVRALAQRLPPEAAARSLELIAIARSDLQLRMNKKVVLTGLLLDLHGLAAP
jgi:DNA polymerase-3 subunit delta'